MPKVQCSTCTLKRRQECTSRLLGCSKETDSCEDVPHQDSGIWTAILKSEGVRIENYCLSCHAWSVRTECPVWSRCWSHQADVPCSQEVQHHYCLLSGLSVIRGFFFTHCWQKLFFSLKIPGVTKDCWWWPAGSSSIGGGMNIFPLLVPCSCAVVLCCAVTYWVNDAGICLAVRCESLYNNVHACEVKRTCVASYCLTKPSS